MPGTQVYITVFADGPTRVLRFADAQNVGAEEAEQSVLDLAARLKQVEEQLWRVNAKFSALHGAGGVRDLDLYGRASSITGAGHPPKAEPAPPASARGGSQVHLPKPPGHTLRRVPNQGSSSYGPCGQRGPKSQNLW